ncbi:hypothetical protein ACP70R_005712 [Stipagrostis hirtigluma subsp. patula]
MSSNEDDRADTFDSSGPTHMMEEFGFGSSRTRRIEIDWDKDEHRRCVAACVVQGTYVLESDRTKGRLLNSGEALAPPWWEKFHLSLVETLECECECERERQCPFFGCNGCFIYGAIFQYAPPVGARRHPSAPRYIVAFRGTMLRDPTAARDICLDANILLNRQHKCGRFRMARGHVEELLGKIANGGGGGDDDVWLAGHSLGASIALDVGRGLASRRGCYLPAFLFNPPHVSLAPAADMLRMAEEARNHLYIIGDVLKHALGKTTPLRSHKRRKLALFEQLSAWVPELYVHERDIICKGFADYFEQRQQVQELLPRVARSAAALSWRDMMWRTVFRKEKERPHLLPSAVLWKNSSSDGDTHELRQWWQPGLNLSSKLYSWL